MNDNKDIKQSDSTSSAGKNEPKSKASSAKPKSKANKENKGKSDKGKEKKNNALNNIKKVQKTASATVNATKLTTTVKAIAYLKLRLLMLINGVKNLLSQSLLTIIIAIVITVVTVVSSLWSNLVDKAQTIIRDSLTSTCYVYTSKGAIGSSDSIVSDSTLILESARRIYSVLSYYGLRPEQCFAVLGNWSIESGLDPTAIESVYDESFKIGSTKQEAIAWDFNLVHWNPSYAAEYPDIKRCGIGLGQWTNERNKKLLTYAQKAGNKVYKGDKSEYKQWYDLDIQLAFALDKDCKFGDTKAKWMSEWTEIGDEEWHGDKKISSPYNGDIIAVGDGSEDSYYSDTAREEAYNKAKEEADAKKANGDFDVEQNVGTADSPSYVKKFSSTLYDNYLKTKYRYYLYRNMVGEYTEQFMLEWEGIDNGTLEARQEKAYEYFDMWWDSAETFSSDNGSLKPEPNTDAEKGTDDNASFFKVEKGYGYSVLSVFENTSNWYSAIDSVTKVYSQDSDMSSCTRIVYRNNKSLSQAAAMMAWSSEEKSRDNNGTDLYQYLHDTIFPDDDVYMACDRTVATAVRWSGLDDDYPVGATLNQFVYLVSSKRWTELDWGGDVDQLQPGDILIRKDSVETDGSAEADGDVHHTLIYVGNYIAKIYGKSESDTACVVSGSLDERSPGVGEWSSSYEEYHAFRCTNPQDTTDSKYSALALTDEYAK